MYKIAVMGDWDSIYGFGALGMDTFRFSGKPGENPAQTLRHLAEENYAVIYITEALAAGIPEEIDRLRTQPLPAVILIPGIRGNTGAGMSAVKRSVIQAIGSDIIFGGDNAGEAGGKQ